MQQDIRDEIFASVRRRMYTGFVVAERDGVLSGVRRAQKFLEELGVSGETYHSDGAKIKGGTRIVRIVGTPKALAVAEEYVLGFLSKPSGIATAAREAVETAGPDLRIVCGAWKKMPSEIKTMVREAITHGGAAFRISDEPFIYLDKNFVRMLGGIEASLAAVQNAEGRVTVLQLKGEYGDLATEAISAARHGADIIMIDTGHLADVMAVNEALRTSGLRNRVRLAFAKGIRLETLPALKEKGIDILDIGVDIVDAPLLDMKLEVQADAVQCSHSDRH